MVENVENLRQNLKTVVRLLEIALRISWFLEKFRDLKILEIDLTILEISLTILEIILTILGIVLTILDIVLTILDIALT